MHRPTMDALTAPSSFLQLDALGTRPRFIYERERVSDRVREAAVSGIALIIAAAGFGKTEALRQTYDDESAILIQLDDLTSSVDAFLKRLVDVVTPRQSRSLSALLEKTDPDAIRDTVVPWVAARLRGVEPAIVVDDLHCVFRDPRAGPVLQHLVELTRHSVTWVLSSRETPELPIGTWIAREWMGMPISDVDLAFTTDEARELAKLIGVRISDPDLEQLARETAGWPIAVQFFLSYWERSRTPVPAGLGTRDVLFRYIDEQVWSGIDDEHRRLLEVAAILPRPSLALLGETGFPRAGAELERLSRRITFIQKDERGEYRLHDVFREFITERHRLDRVQYAELIAKVAGALAKLGLSPEALELYTRLGDEQQIVALLETIGFDLIESGHRKSVEDALNALPAPAHVTPMVTALRGHIQMLEGAFATAETELRRALDAAGDGPARLTIAHRLATFYAGRGDYANARTLLESVLGDVTVLSADTLDLRALYAAALATTGEFVSAMEHANAVLGHVTEVPLDRRAGVFHRCALAFYFCDRPQDAEQLASEAAGLALSLQQEQLAARIFSLLMAVSHDISPDISYIEGYARAMEAAATNAGDRQLRVRALQALYLLAAQRGDDDTAEQMERELTALGNVRTFRESFPVRRARFDMLVGRGQFAQARQMLESVDPKTISAAENALRQSLLLLAAIGQGDETFLAAMIQRPFLIEVGPDMPSRRDLAMARIYQSLALWLCGRQSQARRMVVQRDVPLPAIDQTVANTIASILGTNRQVITTKRLEQLTEPLIALNLGGIARFLRRVVAAPISAHAQLTPAEVTLLRAWRPGDTIAELAMRIGKSPNTINAQMRSIAQKTGTSGRGEALEYARDLGLIDRH